MDFATLGGKIGGNEAARRGEGAKKETEEETEREREHQVHPKKALNTSSSEPF